MDDLALVGVHEDGEHLLMTAPDGRRFRLRVDEALRAAVRRDRARLGQLQIEMNGRMRPKEIQARIRAGETAEQVADAAGVPIEHVRRYEGPVLAERGFMAAQAREVRVRRSGAAPGAAETLGGVVAERLAQREVDADNVIWDSWRAEDGRWVVQLEFTAGTRTRRARWSYDASLRHAAPLDDEARWLTEEEPAAAAAAGPQRRLTPVRWGYEIEAAGVPRTAPEDPAAVDLLDTLRERRGRRNRPADDEGGAGDPVREAIDSLLGKADSLGEPPSAHPPRSRPHEARDGEVLVLPEADPLPEATAGEPGHLDDEPAVAAAGARRGTRKQRRASVPSWDDIVFGQRRD